MNARLTLKPGQPGTKKLMQVYGDRLVCVRYRYDREQRKRVKTVELIIDESDWKPPDSIPDSAVVGIRVDIDEKKIQKRIKTIGGKWDPEDRLWNIRFVDAVNLGLKSRVVKVIGGSEEAS